ncbi:hypothetical protein BCR35DRAFT_351156 [Leucosporidium creatinivorum]|uniref:F-box domain-containing protein n=1 Tax=Leucosporidium creatinivorum TaxID=106004 RepID=A0A1Y2FWJ1_9BASI|nr:hypothetical protein BCR35DRAFT_351156 [Leucosporidium creatinivorum]
MLASHHLPAHCHYDPAAGQSLLRALRSNRDLGPRVRSLTFHLSAFTEPATFSDLTSDDILRLCPNLLSLETPVANFAPLADGRAPAANYPSSLRQFRLAPTMNEVEGYESMDEDGGSQSSDATSDGLPGVLKRLEDVPAELRGLKMERISNRSLLQSEAPSNEFPLEELRRFEIVFTNMSGEMLEWMTKKSVAAGTLSELKLWCMGGVPPTNIQALLVTIGANLHSFEYKPQSKDMGALIKQVLPHLPALRHLTLGAGGSDHHIYPLLPTTLESLCIALPSHHGAANLDPLILALGPVGNLQSLRRLELYSQIYFPAPEGLVEYIDDVDSRGFAPLPSLREVRLSHIHAQEGHWARFFALVGPNLRALSLHHINDSSSNIITHCPALRRLELGVAGYAAPNFLNLLTNNGRADHLHLLRIHFISQIPLTSLLATLRLNNPSSGKLLPSLLSLHLTGVFPDNIPISTAEGWCDGRKVDELVRVCEERNVELALNGWRIASLGDLWGAAVKFAMARS